MDVEAVNEETPEAERASAALDVSDIRARLAALVREELDWQGPLPTGALSESFDSLQLMTLVVAVEDTFRICLEPEDEAQIHQVDDLIGIIASKLAPGQRDGGQRDGGQP